MNMTPALAIQRIEMPYSGFSPFGFNGRFPYARAAVNF